MIYLPKIHISLRICFLHKLENCMKVIENEKNYKDIEPGCVLTIGNFDGVHRGHQKIINTAKELARERSAQITAMTFHPHPLAVLHPERAPAVLTPIEYKTSLLAENGVANLIIIRDSMRLLNMSPEAFVGEFLMTNIKPSAVVEGPDFNFGYGRSGTVDTLRQLGAEHSFEVQIVPPEQIKISREKQIVCSSSAIREMLSRGRVATAKRMLSRPYRLMGKTIPGRGKGSQIGYPTANIDPDNQIVPAEGVYAGFVSIADSLDQLYNADQRIPAAFSIGRAKTFLADHPLLTEAHILDRDPGKLYGRFLAMDFIQKLRSQKRFKSEQELKEQINKDCGRAEEILSAPIYNLSKAN